MTQDSVKTILRQRCRHLRKMLSSPYQSDAALRVCYHILSLKAYSKAKNIALYKAINGELCLDPLWEQALNAKKACYFPVLNKNKTLYFLPATKESFFVPNRYGIPEPKVPVEVAIDLPKLDIMFLPVVAFDKKGTRLGTGAGYYDRTLAKEKPSLLIGVAYEFQRQNYISAAWWDVALNAIITPKAIYWV